MFQPVAVQSVYSGLIGAYYLVDWQTVCSGVPFQLLESLGANHCLPSLSDSGLQFGGGHPAQL
jgi:hypothetical protein